MFNANDKIQEFKNILNNQNENSSVKSIGTVYTVTPTEVEITPVTNKYKAIILAVVVIVCLLAGINIANNTISNSNSKVVVDYNENIEDEVVVSNMYEEIKNDISDSLRIIYSTIKVDSENESIYILRGKVNIQNEYKKV